MMSSNARNLHAWKFFVGAFAVLLSLLVVPLWIQSTTLAAPQAQGTLPPRYTPTPESPTVTPTTPAPTTVTPVTTPSPSSQEAVVTPTSLVILLPNTGADLLSPALFLFGMVFLAALGGVVFFGGRRRRPIPPPAPRA